MSDYRCRAITDGNGRHTNGFDFHNSSGSYPSTGSDAWRYEKGMTWEEGKFGDMFAHNTKFEAYSRLVDHVSTEYKLDLREPVQYATTKGGIKIIKTEKAKYMIRNGKFYHHKINV